MQEGSAGRCWLSHLYNGLFFLLNRMLFFLCATLSCCTPSVSVECFRGVFPHCTFSRRHLRSVATEGCCSQSDAAGEQMQEKFTSTITHFDVDVLHHSRVCFSCIVLTLSRSRAMTAPRLSQLCNYRRVTAALLVCIGKCQQCRRKILELQSCFLPPIEAKKKRKSI